MDSVSVCFKGGSLALTSLFLRLGAVLCAMIGGFVVLVSSAHGVYP